MHTVRWPRWSVVLCFGVFFAAAPLNAQPAATPSDPAIAAEASGAAVGDATADAAQANAEAAQPAAPERSAIESRVDAAFGSVVGAMERVLFYTVGGVPIIVAWLVLGALFFTLRMGFINIRGFRHAIKVVRGQYDDPNDAGEVSHFQALSSALSATVGLGNIAGVAIAVTKGGPGAVFWMVAAAFLGMTAKFVECTLGQKYRAVDERGHVLGGPMQYLKVGLAERGLAPLGSVLATVFAVFCIGGSFGGGNMFQVNSAYAAFDEFLPFHLPASVFGIVMMVAVGVVILGGIKRIAQTAEKIVPLMCGLYLVAAGFVVITNLEHLPAALSTIFSGAFSADAVEGGVIGVIIIGFQRAAFSNEAGIGSAAIAHSAARTDEPIREGLVALLEPFIDTIIVCLATGLVIVISGVYADPAQAGLDGAVLTAHAFSTVISWFPVLLSIAIILFAYSTMISWSYYGERCWTALFGAKSSMAYKVIFLACIYIGSVSSLEAVIGFSDLMILSMAFPNILGLYILSNAVKRDLDSYMSRLADGSMDRENAASHDVVGPA